MSTPREYIGRLDPHTGLPPAQPDSTVLPPAWAVTPAWASPPPGPAAPPPQTVDQIWLAKIEGHLNSMHQILLAFMYLTIIGIVITVMAALSTR